MIFDDPIDSHDNYNKHFIIDMIMKNLSTLDVVSILLTHSSDVMRSMKMNYKYCTNFYMMTSESDDLVFKLDNDSLSVFNGVFPFFQEVYKKKGNNIYLDMVSLLPIFRDIVEHAKTLKYKSDDSNDYEALYKQLSNDFLHYNANGKNKDLKELYSIYSQHLDKFQYNMKDLSSNESVAAMSIVEFVKHRRKYNKPDVSNLVENIKFKNILGLYLRVNIERIIYEATISKIDKKLKKSFKSEFRKWFTVSKKINSIKKIYYDTITEKDQIELNQFFEDLNRYKHVANDFHHQINTYITPVLETKLDGLLKMCDDIDILGERI